jgi:1,2-dihydroxy-3-keto-5-methylthiopentene dioxygenase
MSLLHVYRADAPEAAEEITHDGERIATILRSIGVRFERWPAGRALADDASPDDILAAYAPEIERLRAESSYQRVDVVRVPRGLPDTSAMRAKFLAEHCHTEDEIRFFVEGSGSFYLHVDDRVFQVVCAQNDLISVPAKTRHWFDMGTAPYFCAIRMFIDPAGWVAHFTGDTIASRFPTHDAAVAA